MSTTPDLLADYASGTVRPSEVVLQSLHDLESTDLGVLEEPLTEMAIRLAEHSDRRYQNSSSLPLDGIPFGVKDIIHIEGTPITFGSSEERPHVSKTTATAVTRLMAAGAIPVAKLKTYEFAAGPNDFTVNPHDPQRMSGGSSSGSAAAVGAGLLPIALGTDTGGSVRVPAAWCGAVGIKPTFGLVSRYGVAPLSWTLDHVGVLSQTPVGARMAVDVLEGRDSFDPYSAKPRRPHDSIEEATRIGVPSAWFEGFAQSDIVASLDAATAAAIERDWEIIEIDLPEINTLNPDIIKHVLVSAEAASLHESSSRVYGEKFTDLLQRGERLWARDYTKALRMRSVLQMSVERALDNCDLLLTPTCPITAPVRGTETVDLAQRLHTLGTVVARYTSLFNITGHPAVTFPGGTDSHGLPIGLQLIGRFWADSLVLDAAAQLTS